MNNKYIIKTPQFEALSEGNPSPLWELTNGTVLRLLTLDQLKTLQSTHPDKYLVDILGETCMIKDCDDDIRFGYVAYGVIYSEN